LKKKLYVILSILIAFIHILPFYILVTVSFKSVRDLSSRWIMPGYWFDGNFINAWKQSNMGQAFYNNIVIFIFSVLLIVIVGAVASYPLSRYRTKLNRIMYMIFISALIVPPLTILVPLYKFYVDLGALNTHWGIVLLHVTFNLPITIFLYTGFIGTIPKELDEAGMIDGLSRLRLFFSIIMPLLKPITATVVILTGVTVWNDYQFSIFFLQKPDYHTITVALSRFYGQYNNNINWVAAGSLIGAVPITLVYLFLQRFFISGLSSGAVKG
jgi:raffinose/stachyose/melibiose transport system permease protein